jgi:hypothetical protein
VEGVQVRPPSRIDLDEGVRHQGVVRDVPIALVVRRDGARRAPVGQERADDAGHPTAVPLLDLLGRPSFGGAAQRVADGCAREHTGHAVLDHIHRALLCLVREVRGGSTPPRTLVMPVSR